MIVFNVSRWRTVRSATDGLPTVVLVWDNEGAPVVGARLAEGTKMDAQDVCREVLSLRREWLTANPPQRRPEKINMPWSYGDALWTEFRARLDPDERVRIESRDGHPADGGKLYGMTIRLVDEDEGAAWISSTRRVLAKPSR